MFDVRQLKVLLELGERGSFSAAADALDYTQSAVSKQVAALERAAGMPLVERGVRPVRLTDAGRALAGHAEAVVARLATADEELRAIAELRSGRLRLGTFAAAGPTLVVPALVAFRERFPGIEISIVEAGPLSLAAAVRAGELDLAVVNDYPAAGQALDDGLELHHLLDDPDDVILPAHHRLARAKRVTIADLREETWLFPTLDPAHPSARIIMGACADAGFEPEIAFHVNDCETTQALVAAGTGVALLPRLAIHPVHPDVVIRPVDPTPVRRVAAVRLPAAHLTPASAAFLEIIRGAARR